MILISRIFGVYKTYKTCITYYIEGIAEGFLRGLSGCLTVSSFSKALLVKNNFFFFISKMKLWNVCSTLGCMF